MSESTREGSLRPLPELDGFVIEAVAGRGGMGVVYRARQEQPERVVALKVIAGDLADDVAFRARFQQESNIAAQIEHPNVIPVYAVGEAGGVLYIVMRFIEGTDLGSLLTQEPRMAPARAAAIVDAVGQALDAAHALGLVHRDVKPANVMISSVGGHDHPYLSDFGLSRHIEGSGGLTGTGAFLGTIDYVAPEQARGDRVDARTDVYALGCVLFRALTGTVPFPLDNDLAKLYAHDRQPPPSPLERVSDLPAAFESVLARAMAKSPDERYPSAGDLGRAAVAAASGASLGAPERSVAAGGAAPAATHPMRLGRPSEAPDGTLETFGSDVGGLLERHYETVVRQMVEQGTVVPLLGSRVCGSLPDADEIAAALARQFDLELEPPGLAKIAQHVYVSSGRPDLHRALRQILAGASELTPVHRFLARFPGELKLRDLAPRYQMIITTNYDSALERAFDEANEPYDLAVYIAAGEDRGKFVHFPFGGDPELITIPNRYGKFPIDDYGDLERTVIVKTHGGVDPSRGEHGWKGTYVITEDHYIDYLSESPIEGLVPVQILAKLTESHCLFLGYGLRDWNMRVFLKRIWQGEPPGSKSWAIERDPDGLEQDFWRQFQVDVIAAPLAEYVDELRKRIVTRRGASRAQ